MGIINIAVLGSGVMGKQLAILFSSHGNNVVLWNHIFRDDVKEYLKRTIKLESRLGNINDTPDILKRIHYTNSVRELQKCNVIIECIKEDYEAKKYSFKLLDGFIGKDCIIATNTSALSLKKLGTFLPDARRFAGVHFFNPPLSIQLVELVKGEHTSCETIDVLKCFLLSLGKKPVILQETPGFIVNRIMFPMINEAIFLLSEGIADARTIDNCMQMGAKHPIGPLELADFIGLDVCLNILDTLFSETGKEKYSASPLLREHVSSGKLGRKTSIGFYPYGKR